MLEGADGSDSHRRARPTRRPTARGCRSRPSSRRRSASAAQHQGRLVPAAEGRRSPCPRARRATAVADVGAPAVARRRPEAAGQGVRAGRVREPRARRRRASAPPTATTPLLPARAHQPGDARRAQARLAARARAPADRRGHAAAVRRGRRCPGKDGVIHNSFAGIPDVPLERFELAFTGGATMPLTLHRDACRGARQTVTRHVHRPQRHGRERQRAAEGRRLPAGRHAQAQARQAGQGQARPRRREDPHGQARQARHEGQRVTGSTRYKVTVDAPRRPGSWPLESGGNAPEGSRDVRGAAGAARGAARGRRRPRLREGGREAAREGQVHGPRADREAARPGLLPGARHLRPPPDDRVRHAEEPALGRRRRHRPRHDRRAPRLRLRQDFTVFGGSLSARSMAEKICKIMDLAAKIGAP